jgi:hypothetical protein
MFGNPDEHLRRPRKSLWKCSPFYNLWKALYQLGAPLGASELMGGISLPIVPKASTQYHYRWLSYLSSRNLEDLIVGLGLAPSTGTQKSVLDDRAREWVRNLRCSQEELRQANANLRTTVVTKLVKRPVLDPNTGRPAVPRQWVEFVKELPPQEPFQLLLTEDPDDIDGTLRVSLTVAYRNAIGKLRSAEFYYRTAPDPRTPSARLYLQKFVRKVSSVPPIGGRYGNVAEDLARKLFVFLVRRESIPEALAEDSQTHYGLESSSPIRRRQIAPTKVVLA